MLRVDGNNCSLYLRDYRCFCSVGGLLWLGHWWCWWGAGRRCRVTLCWCFVYFSFSLVVQASVRFPNSPSSSVFGVWRRLGLSRVVQLCWIQSLDEWRFFSSVKKDGPVVQRVALIRCSWRCLWVLILLLVLVCLCSSWINSCCYSAFFSVLRIWHRDIGGPSFWTSLCVCPGGS